MKMKDVFRMCPKCGRIQIGGVNFSYSPKEDLMVGHCKKCGYRFEKPPLDRADSPTKETQDDNN